MLEPRPRASVARPRRATAAEMPSLSRPVSGLTKEQSASSTPYPMPGAAEYHFTPRRGAQRGHDPRDLRHLRHADGDLIARERAEGLAKLAEQTPDAGTAPARLGREAQEGDRRRDAVLVAHGVRIDEVAERLLESVHDAWGAGYPLEPGEGRGE